MWQASLLLLPAGTPKLFGTKAVTSHRRESLIEVAVLKIVQQDGLRVQKNWPANKQR
jgi:hypothetical protein